MLYLMLITFLLPHDDWILTKYDQYYNLAIEKTKNNIINSTKDIILKIDKKDIEQYLFEVKDAVENNRYRLDRNARRQTSAYILF